MKKLLLCLFILATATALFTAFRPEEKKDWEMKQYFFVMLTKGPNRSQDSVAAAKMQEGHLANITRMHDEGKLCIAGPFGDDTDWRGILILDVKTKEEAIAELGKDPAIAAGRLKYDIHPWWGGVGSTLK